MHTAIRHVSGTDSAHLYKPLIFHIVLGVWAQQAWLYKVTDVDLNVLRLVHDFLPDPHDSPNDGET